MQVEAAEEARRQLEQQLGPMQAQILVMQVRDSSACHCPASLRLTCLLHASLPPCPSFPYRGALETLSRRETGWV